MLFIISIVYPVNTHILSQGSGSIAAVIGLIAAGLSLFLLILVVNLVPVTAAVPTRSRRCQGR